MRYTTNRIRVVLLSLAAIAGLAAGGCAAVGGEVARAKVYRARENVGLALVAQAAKAKPPQNRYLAIQAKKNKTGAQASIVLPCDMWAPFRWEIRGGVFDPDFADRTDGAIFGTELDERGGFPPTRYYGVSAQVTSGGLNAYAFTHMSTAALGPHFFAGATRVDFAIEADGGTMEFYARAAGDTDWVLLASVPFAGQSVPLNPSVGVFNFGDRGKVGFDDWRLLANGVSPTALTPEQEVARLAWVAAGGIVESQHGLDGGAPDYAGAATELAGSVAGLDEAILATDQIESKKTRKKAARDLESAKSKVESALGKVEDENAGKALDRLESAFKKILKAVHRVDPLPD